MVWVGSWMEELVGREITSVWQRNDGTELLLFFVEGQTMMLTAEGDCCANAYIESVDTPEWMIGVVTRTEARDATDASGVSGETASGDVLDVTFYEISTKRGTCVIELRVEHNGYYGGTIDGSSVDVNLPLEFNKWKQLA